MTRIQSRSAPPRSVQRLIDDGTHPLLARIYAARGITRRTELDYALKALLPPAALRGTHEAAQLLEHPHLPTHQATYLGVHGDGAAEVGRPRDP